MANSPDDLLSFKEFDLLQDDYNTAQLNIDSPVKKATTSATTASPVEDVDRNNGDETKKNYSFLSLEYYQQFFNVDTILVVERIVTSMIPKRAASNYLRNNIGANPDLYGPFWIIVTLVFTIAISGNLASYLQHANTDFHWRYNFHLVSYTATAIITYASLVPLALWALFKWTARAQDIDLEETSLYTPSLLSLICLYGYSLAVYIPVSILWTVQVSLLQWLLVMTGAFLSGSVLIITLMPAIKQSRFNFILCIAIAGMHFILAAGFMLYFFHVPSSVAPEPSLPTPGPPPVVSVATSLAAANKTG